MDYPGIFFFPLIEAEPVNVMGLEQGVLARRLPDFLCIFLNQGNGEKIGLLELRAADPDGQPTGEWAEFKELPEPSEVLDLLPREGVQAAVIGTLEHDAGHLHVKLTIIRGEHGVSTKTLCFDLNLKQPATDCIAMAKALADELSLTINAHAWDKHGTMNGRAFLEFLRGLDGAARLDPQLTNPRNPKELVSPFVDALERDPGFGLALRRFHVTVTDALMGFAISMEDAIDLFDRAYATFPNDTESVASIGEYLPAIGENERAEDWLRLAIEDDDPPAQALEALGILLANRGDVVQARNLWLTAVQIDGHPDLFAHLARVAFTEENYDEAWDKTLRGLRRISERSLHPGEWGDEEGRGGILFRYLTEHLEDLDLVNPPPDVLEILLDLTAQINEPEDRMDLGICLALLGSKEKAIQALNAALPHVEDTDRRDLGCHHLGNLLMPGFDKTFAEAVESLEEDRDRSETLRYFQSVSKELPQFWPAHFYQGEIHEEHEDWQNALDAYRQSCNLRSSEANFHSKIALCSHRLGMKEEALDAMGKALDLEPGDAGLHADNAILLMRDGRSEEAQEALEIAETLDLNHPAVTRAKEVLHQESS